MRIKLKDLRAIIAEVVAEAKLGIAGARENPKEKENDDVSQVRLMLRKIANDNDEFRPDDEMLARDKARRDDPDYSDW